MATPSTKEVLAPHKIATSYYSSLSGRSSDLVNAIDDSEALVSRSNWHTFNFKEPVYIFEIKVETEDFAAYDEFRIVVNCVDGSTHDELLPLTNGVLTLRAGKLSSGFSFKPPAKALARPKIKSVVTYGLTREEFNKYEWAIKDFEKNSADLRKREAALLELEAALPELRLEKSSLDSEVGKSRAQLDKLTADMSAKEAAISALQSQVEDVNLKLAELKADSASESTKLKKAQEERNDIILQLRNYPAQITGFINEGNRGIRWYVGLAVPFAIILIFVTFRLINGSLDLIQSLPLPEGVSIWSALLVRLPFVLLALAIIEVSGSICARMMFEVVKINRQRLDFSKISIIAKDVTKTSSGETSLSDDEIFEREVALRMDLLREHMKSYTGTEFEYRGSNIGAAILGMLAKFAPTKS